jgi:hypothetical protein
MRAYQVTARDTNTVLGTRYAGTQADARTKRDELMAQFDVKKNQVSIDEVEVPVAKSGLLEFINELASQADAVEAEEE